MRTIPVLLCLLSCPVAALAQEDAAAPTEEAVPAPSSSDFPSWSGLVATASATGFVNAAAPGSNPRPVSFGAGYARWSELASALVQVTVAPSLDADGAAAGGTLLRSTGRLGLDLGGRLHRFHGRGALPLSLTLGGYARGGASLDTAGDASWMALRADAGLSLSWWPTSSAERLVYLTLDVGPTLRHRGGDVPGTWLGLSTGVSLTVRRVTAGLLVTHVPEGDAPMPGLTGTRVSAGVSLQADLLPL